MWPADEGELKFICILLSCGCKVISSQHTDVVFTCHYSCILQEPGQSYMIMIEFFADVFLFPWPGVICYHSASVLLLLQQEVGAELHC